MLRIPPDFRGAVRGLLRSRGLLGLSVACLALGLGTSAAMLGLLDLLLFRPPAHVREAESLHRLYLTEVIPGFGASTSSIVSYPTFRDLQATRAFRALGAFHATRVSLGRGVAARQARAVLVTPELLRLLGVRPKRGRLFESREGRPGPPDFVALLSAERARRDFGGAEKALGGRIFVGSGPYTIVGVLPERFTGVDLESVDLWLPMNAAGEIFIPQWAESRGSKFLQLVANRRGEVAVQAAEGEATAALRAGADAAGRPQPLARVVLGPIQAARGPEAPATVRVATWLTGLSWIVLLIACANVAGLLLTRGIERRAELAMRLALGATPRRLMALALWEGGVLALLGGLGGALVAPILGALVQRAVLSRTGIPFEGSNPRTLAFLVLLSLLAGLIAAVLPAWWVGRRDLLAALRSGVREAGPGRSRLQSALAAGQLAFTFLLLVSAGAFAWSLWNALHQRLGLDADRVWVATPDRQERGARPREVEASLQGAAERVRYLPGVTHVALGAAVPFASSMGLLFAVPGVETLPELPTGGPYANAVSADFFATTGTRILRGRPFIADDSAAAERVAIVNQTMAHALWPNREALGRCIVVKAGAEGAPAPCARVVGVAEDANREELREEPTMQWYLPLAQAPARFAAQSLFVRGPRGSSTLAGSIRKEMLALEPKTPFIAVQTLADLLADQLQPWRMGAAVLAFFGILALALASTGLYGVLATAMARRRYELGLRAALGAEGRHLAGLALRQGLGIGLGGVAAGLFLARLAAGRLSPLLFDVSPFHPALLGGAALVTLSCALLASGLPARRAKRVDLATVLRAD